MFTHHYNHIPASVFLCLMTGVFSSASAQAAAAMAINKYKSNRSGGSDRDRWRCGRVGGARVEKYVLRERMSGQVDWELEISCQTQDLCSRVWKVPVCLQAPHSSFLIHSLFFSAPFSLDGIDVNRWRLISSPLLPLIPLSGHQIEGNLTAAWATAIS